MGLLPQKTCEKYFLVKGGQEDALITNTKNDVRKKYSKCFLNSTTKMIYDPAKAFKHASRYIRFIYAEYF